MLGFPLALSSKALAVSLIPDLKPGIGVWLTMGAALVVVLGLMAAFVPALRAARIQPMEALGHD